MPMVSANTTTVGNTRSFFKSQSVGRVEHSETRRNNSSAEGKSCYTGAATKPVHDTRDLPYAYKGKATVIPSVTGDFCPAYCEVVLGAAESARTSTAPLEFNKQVKTEG